MNIKKHFRNKKISEKDILKIRKLRKSGMKLVKIAEIFNVNYNSIKYHLLTKEQKKKRIKRVCFLQKKRGNKNIKKGYMNDYMKERYYNDKDFRKKVIKLSDNYRRKV